MNLEALALGLTVLSVVIGATWKLSSSISDVQAKVDLMLENHLPHLQDAINEVKAEQARMRDKSSL